MAWRAERNGHLWNGSASFDDKIRVIPAFDLANSGSPYRTVGAGRAVGGPHTLQRRSVTVGLPTSPRLQGSLQHMTPPPRPTAGLRTFEREGVERKEWGAGKRARD